MLNTQPLALDLWPKYLGKKKLKRSDRDAYTELPRTTHTKKTHPIHNFYCFAATSLKGIDPVSLDEGAGAGSEVSAAPSARCVSTKTKKKKHWRAGNLDQVDHSLTVRVSVTMALPSYCAAEKNEGGQCRRLLEQMQK